MPEQMVLTMAVAFVVCGLIGAGLGIYVAGIFIKRMLKCKNSRTS